MDFKIKYLKYKKKYLNLKKIVGGYKFIFEGKEYDIKDYRDELKKLIKKIQNSKENENIITDKILIFLLCQILQYGPKSIDLKLSLKLKAKLKLSKEPKLLLTKVICLIYFLLVQLV